MVAAADLSCCHRHQYAQPPPITVIDYGHSIGHDNSSRWTTLQSLSAEPSILQRQMELKRSSTDSDMTFYLCADLSCCHRHQYAQPPPITVIDYGHSIGHDNSSRWTTLQQGDSHLPDSAFDIRLLPTPWQFACLLPVNMLTMRIGSTSQKRTRCDLEEGRKIPIKLLDYKALPGLIKIFGPMEALNLLGIRFTKAVVMDSMIPLNEKGDINPSVII
uniref:Uncharacterized protein n=1 Tax=Oryza brachyantha TaxID=4533 RepID=J3MF12_ORYBR